MHGLIGKGTCRDRSPAATKTTATWLFVFLWGFIFFGFGFWFVLRFGLRLLSLFVIFLLLLLLYFLALFVLFFVQVGVLLLVLLFELFVGRVSGGRTLRSVIGRRLRGRTVGIILRSVNSGLRGTSGTGRSSGWAVRIVGVARRRSTFVAAHDLRRGGFGWRSDSYLRRGRGSGGFYRRDLARGG